MQAPAIHGAQRRADRFDGDGIDVPSECRHAQLVRLADRGPRAHEGVENDVAPMIVLLVELGPQVRFLGQDASE
ncbi:MAG: hypothetical protein ABR915_20625 [Thermoguttaceae bacterium]